MEEEIPQEQVRGYIELNSPQTSKTSAYCCENTECIPSLNSFSLVLTEPVSLPGLPYCFNQAAVVWSLSSCDSGPTTTKRWHLWCIPPWSGDQPTLCYPTTTKTSHFAPKSRYVDIMTL